jgi:hypothetical protein
MGGRHLPLPRHRAVQHGSHVVTAPYRPYANLSLSELLALARRSTTPEALIGIAPALPRTPADLLRECERAAGIATTHNEEPKP